MHLDRATRELEAALLVARSARRTSPRARRIERDLGRVLYAMGDVGTIGQRYGSGDDPDLMSEDERNRLAREQREAERLAARDQADTEQPTEEGEG
jgi:hypothetical protein